MPRANRYLLLYALDIFSVFARASDKNLMTAPRAFKFHSQIQLITNKFPVDLAAIFCRSIISHPQHEMLPREHALNQKVLEFLIAQQDWFMVDLSHPDYDIHGPGNRQSEEAKLGETHHSSW